ncbi:hypothetical protein [Rhizobium sp. BK176]|uniref:hypothetical protein n=1 Tax=Rhizobium sp. BK176 TaxID=2587071 RepID=UPI002167DDE8|nr:hypothetical protein [Rhizobium sp. BK176]MCS4090190.1 hypothetical protein [Rhizobium sp. BK176]
MLFRYPALVTGIPRGFKKPRLCVVVREIDLAIGALAAHEAPVAAILISKNSAFGQDTLIELPVRHVDGRFYIPDPTEPKALQGILSAPFVDCPIRSDFLKLMNRKVPTYSMEREGVWPQGVGLSLSLGMDRFSTEEAITKLKEVVLTDEGQAEADVVDAMAEARHADIVVIDGRLWRRVPEPTYVASLGDYPLQIAITDVLGFVGVPMAADVVYPLTAFEKAVETMNSFGNRVSDTSPRATVFMPEVFREQFDDVNYARFARQLAAMPRYGVEGRHLTPFLEEIQEITSVRVDEIDLDLLEGVVARALAEADRMQGETGTQLTFGMGKELMAFHLDRWENRTVEIARVVHSPGMVR